ncbi:flagellar hook-basal body complex protein [Halovulum dunhuangense]|uniref:Flagellar hook protein FlgE n=1 Tax=Halovulum dunhuangense TaxID=1505036 RepID=A0A849KQC7_9RHOB|nr:flagellar hook-basal body complex protein [Halovulum dunhuangense]NNU79273.1 flagellar hook-basal body complex protein [Halovulum dunhuangense]
MSISSSLNAGVSGLSANSSRLATISDNIANSGTYGYKRADVDFSSVVISQRAGTYSAGGVRVDTFRDVEAQGPLVSTDNPTDLAVGGRGMLPVTLLTEVDAADGTYPFLLTSTGSFRPNADGYLVSESGLVLMGWPADADGNIPVQPRDSASGLDPVIVNRNQFSASPTTEMTLGVNLPAEATQAGAAGIPLEVSTQYFDNVGASQTLVTTFTPAVPAVGQSNNWTITMTDMAQGGAVVGTFSVAFDATAGTGGTILSVTPALGSFDPATGIASVTTASGPLSIDLGIPGTGSGLTQLSADFSPAGVTRNGAAVGTLTGVNIDPEGMVIATYDSGFTRVIYQVPIVNLANFNGLRAEDNQAFSVTRESGPFYLWNAGEGPTGQMIAYAREESTADIAAELTHLIETQRAYSSNAKIIQTVDEMLQETTNLKR